MFFSQNFTRIEGHTPCAESKTKNSVKICLINRCEHEFVESEKFDQICEKIETLKEILVRARVVEDQLKGLPEGEHCMLKETIDDINDEIQEIDGDGAEVILAKYLKKELENDALNEVN